MEKISIVIVDDHLLFADGLRSLLEKEPLIEEVSITINSSELEQYLRVHIPHLLLLDINLPGKNGLDILTGIRRRYPSVKAIILSTYNDKHLIEKARAAGAHGYLLKTTSIETLLQSVELVIKGLSCFPQQSTTQLHHIDELGFLMQFNLSRRELDIVRKIKEGYTNQQMADHFHLSIYTVETHRKNIMQKLSLNKTAELHKFLHDHL